MQVVKELVLPIADDVMAVDWAAEGLVSGPIAPGSAIRLTFAKLKEGSWLLILLLVLFQVHPSLYCALNDVCEQF